MPRHLGRNHVLVGNEVVHKTSPETTRVAQIVQLQRRDAVCEQAQAVALRVALQVNRNVQCLRTYLLHRLAVAEIGHIDEVITRSAQTGLHGVGSAWSVGKKQHLKFVALVLLNQPGHQMARRMGVKIS